MKLIDADALLNKAWDAENGFGWEKVISLNDVVNAPTVDAVLVIRCKDCKHSPAAHDDCPLPAQYIVPEGYCYLGEKKDDQSKI